MWPVLVCPFSTGKSSSLSKTTQFTLGPSINNYKNFDSNNPEIDSWMHVKRLSAFALSKNLESKYRVTTIFVVLLKNLFMSIWHFCKAVFKLNWRATSLRLNIILKISLILLHEWQLRWPATSFKHQRISAFITSFFRSKSSTLPDFLLSSISSAFQGFQGPLATRNIAVILIDEKKIKLNMVPWHNLMTPKVI